MKKVELIAEIDRVRGKYLEYERKYREEVSESNTLRKKINGLLEDKLIERERAKLLEGEVYGLRYPVGTETPEPEYSKRNLV